MYKVIKLFHDLQDNNHLYDPNNPDCNTYPREGLKPTAERIAELSGTENKRGCPLIEKAEKSLGDMKVDELKAYAADKGIELGEAKNKADILAKIKEAEEATK